MCKHFNIVKQVVSSRKAGYLTLKEKDDNIYGDNGIKFDPQRLVNISIGRNRVLRNFGHGEGRQVKVILCTKWAVIYKCELIDIKSSISLHGIKYSEISLKILMYDFLNYKFKKSVFSKF